MTLKNLKTSALACFTEFKSTEISKFSDLVLKIAFVPVILKIKQKSAAQ